MPDRRPRGGAALAALLALSPWALAMRQEPALSASPGPEAARPDLVLAGVALVPPEPEERDAVSFLALVLNQASAPAPGSRVWFVVDRVALRAASAPQLGPGSMAVVSVAV